jgi:uncharacterized protein (DUF58 family)
MSKGWVQRWWNKGSGRLGGSDSGFLNTGTPAGAKPQEVRPWMDLQALMSIRSLELRVQRMVQGLHRGLHRSVRRGHSSEFAEYRPYTPGDDLRHMDWRRMARTDRPYLRKYEEESDRACLVVADLSASMAFGTIGYSKADYGRTLAGTLATFLHGQGDPVGLLRFAAGVGELVPVGHAPRQMARWWSLLAAEPSGSGTGLRVALEEARRILRRPGLVVLVSDLLVPSEQWAEALRFLRAAGHEVVVFEILDPQEIEFNFEGDTHFVGLEDARRLDLDAPRARQGYRDRMQAHREAVAVSCARESALFWSVRSDAPLEPLLREAITAIGRRRQNSGGRPLSTRSLP